MSDITDNLKRILPGSYDRIPEELKKPLTSDDFARIEKAQKELQSKKVGCNYSGLTHVSK